MPPSGPLQHERQIAGVAGVEPAVRERLGRRLRVPQVLVQRLRAAVDDLALLAARQQRATRIHDPDLDVDHLGAHGTRMRELVLGPEQRRHRAHLGLPEREVELALEHVQAFAQQTVGHRRHRVRGLAQ